jgi:hydrogenase maturation protease
MSCALRIIGIGSPFGDDRLGWVVAERLRAHPAIRALGGEVEVLTADRPGPRLIELWRGAASVILVDAVRSGAAPGTLFRLDADEAMALGAGASSHGFGMGETLLLARTLGALPPRLSLLGAEAAETATCGESLSAAVAAALPALVEAALGEARAVRARPATAACAINRHWCKTRAAP